VRSWRNWQTHQLEGLAVAIPWWFESTRPHHLFQTPVNSRNASTQNEPIHFDEANVKTHPLALPLCSVLFAVGAAFGQTPSDSSLITNPVFTKSCAKCHGKTAEGHRFGGPSLISEKTAATSADDLHDIIANGKGHMPRFVGKLTAEEIDTLVKQIQTLNKE
jgi:mono/diheme cytochrome c family protein